MLVLSRGVRTSSGVGACPRAAVPTNLNLSSTPPPTPPHHHHQRSPRVCVGGGGGSVSVERVVSGRGLAHIFEFLCQHPDWAPRTDAAVVTAFELAGDLQGKVRAAVA